MSKGVRVKWTRVTVVKMRILKSIGQKLRCFLVLVTLELPLWACDGPAEHPAVKALDAEGQPEFYLIGGLAHQIFCFKGGTFSLITCMTCMFSLNM